ncbi:hypothetical protein WDU94_010919 [Cyamophila willieti]
MIFQQVSSEDPQTIANMFADNFSNNYSSHHTTHVQDLSLYPNSLININHITLSESKLRNLLEKLPKNACRGPDEISPILFIRCADSLAPPLALIFQKSIDTGVLPSRWKTSYISPIFKPGSKTKNDVSMYRPVCISSIIPKLLENLISHVLYPILSSIIEDQQHGFMKHRSTATNLVSFYEFVADVIRDGGQVDCICIYRFF